MFTFLWQNINNCIINLVFLHFEKNDQNGSRFSNSTVIHQGRRTRGGCGCFNTHTFLGERVQHPHFFRSFVTNALQQSLSVSLAALCLRSLRLPPLPSLSNMTPADDWLFCLKSRLSWCVRFIGQLMLRRRELMLWLFTSPFSRYFEWVYFHNSFDLFSVCSECVFIFF